MTSSRVTRAWKSMRQTSTRDARRDATMDATTNGTGTTVPDASVPAKTYPRIGGGDGRGGDPWTNVDVSCPIDGYDADVWRARVDLAAAYQLCDAYGYNEGVCNHLTCVAPGRDDAFLVAPYGLAWSEVTASNLVMIDGSGKILEGPGEVDATAFFIHLAIHRAGVACVLHTHMPRASALCCVESFELAMCHQNSLRFAGDVAYDPTFNGLVLDNTEGERLVEVMDGKRVLMHKHHGVIVCGATVAEAFDDLYYLERAAEVQILAMSTGSPLSIISDEIGRKFREDMESDGGKARWARLHYDARLRELARDPLRKIFTS